MFKEMIMNHRGHCLHGIDLLTDECSSCNENLLYWVIQHQLDSFENSKKVSLIPNLFVPWRFSIQTSKTHSSCFTAPRIFGPAFYLIGAFLEKFLI
jgi:hypothetical protein